MALSMRKLDFLDIFWTGFFENFIIKIQFLPDLRTTRSLSRHLHPPDGVEGEEGKQEGVVDLRRQGTGTRLDLTLVLLLPRAAQFLL